MTKSQPLDSAGAPPAFRDIINSMCDELYVTDGEGFTLFVSDAATRHYGVRPESLVGKHVTELVKDGTFAPSSTMASIEKRDRVTLAQRSRNGRLLICTSTPTFDERGGISLVVTNVRDVTELMNLTHRLDEAEKHLRRCMVELATMHPAPPEAEGIIAESPVMLEVIDLVHRIAQVDSTVLLQGESGVGKDVLASLLHRWSPRKKQPFVKLNCGAIPETLIESELFGYAPGAFTGALRTGKPGIFEVGNGGTVFLNEVSELPLNLQVKLLDIIQDRKVTRVGAVRPIQVDIRLIAATNRDLAARTNQGLFREDLFYRLNVLPVHIPPLRSRREDIPALALQQLKRCTEKNGIVRRISPEVMDALIGYDWPGNVRELQNIVERMAITSSTELILPQSLPAEIAESRPRPANEQEASASSMPPFLFTPLPAMLDRVEKTMIEEALTICDSTYDMAMVLGVSQPTVVRKMQKYGIAPKNRPPEECRRKSV